MMDVHFSTARQSCGIENRGVPMLNLAIWTLDLTTQTAKALVKPDIHQGARVSGAGKI
jgi:hypothetical protein